MRAISNEMAVDYAGQLNLSWRERMGCRKVPRAAEAAGIVALCSQ
jgi:hypothetical protein